MKLTFCDLVEILNKNKGYYSLALFSKTRPFWELFLRACNLCSDCPISNLIDAFNSFQNYLSNDVLKLFSLYTDSQL